jgi:ketosteroid isomerase-like protein
MTTITDLDDFKALDPFFRIIEKGLDGIADGGHFFDLLAEDVIFDYIITTPGYPRHVEGRKAIAELYRPYGTVIVLDRCHDLAVHHDTRTGVVVLEYASEGRVVRTGRRTPTGTSRYSRSPIGRSLTGATTSTPWRSSTRSDGRPVETT